MVKSIHHDCLDTALQNYSQQLNKNLSSNAKQGPRCLKNITGFEQHYFPDHFCQNSCRMCKQPSWWKRCPRERLFQYTCPILISEINKISSRELVLESRRTGQHSGKKCRTAFSNRYTLCRVLPAKVVCRAPQTGPKRVFRPTRA